MGIVRPVPSKGGGQPHAQQGIEQGFIHKIHVERAASSQPHLGKRFCPDDETPHFLLKPRLKASRAAVGLLEVRPILAEQLMCSVLVSCGGLPEEQLRHGGHVQCFIAPCDNLHRVLMLLGSRV